MTILLLLLLLLLLLIIMIIIIIIMISDNVHLCIGTSAEVPHGATPKKRPARASHRQPPPPTFLVPPAPIAQSSREFRGNHLSNATCLTHVSFKSDESCSNVWWSLTRRKEYQTNEAILDQYSLWRWGVTSLFEDVSRETPDVTTCRTSPPMAFLLYMSRAKCSISNTMSHLTAAGCSVRQVMPPKNNKI